MLKNVSARSAASAALVTSTVCYTLYSVASPPLLVDEGNHQFSINTDGDAESHQGRKNAAKSDGSNSGSRSSSDSNWVVVGVRDTIKFISGTARKPRVWERETEGGQRGGEGHGYSSATLARAPWYYIFPIAAGTASITELVSYPFSNAAFRLQLFAASPFSSMDPLNLRTSESFKQEASSVEALEFMQTTVKTKGVRALWEGSAAVVVRQGMMAGGTLTLYASLRGSSDREGQQQQYTNIPRQFISGGVAAAVSQIIVNPLDVSRARIEADLRRASEMMGYKPRYETSSEAIYGILRMQGAGKLFAGLAPSILRSSLAYGAALTTYDNMKVALAAMYPQHHHKSSVNTQVMSALCSTVAFCAFYVPLDNIRGAMVEGRHAGSSLVQVLRGSGPKLFSGLGPTMHRLVPFQVTLFVMVEQVHQSVYSKPLFD